MNQQASASPAAAKAAAKAAAIAQYVAAGVPLIPINGKIPAVRGWREAKVNQYPLAALAGRNYGIVIPADIVVVDVDPRNFTAGDKPLSRLKKLLGSDLASFTVRSGGGGVHIYLRKPADFGTRVKHPDFPGIDFKRLGGYVVGPGSIHPDTGKEYFVERASPGEIADAPAELLALLARSSASEEWSDAGTGKYVDDEGTRGRYADYLRGSAPTSGSFLVACHGRDLGLAPQRVWEMMVEHWSPRRSSPRTPDELKDRVIHAYQYAHGAVGSSHPSVDFDPIEPPPGGDEAAAKEKEKRDRAPNFKTGPNGAAAKCFSNLLHYLRLAGSGLDGIFGYNQFTAQVEFTNPAPWHEGRLPTYPAVHDDDLVQLKAFLVTRYNFEMPVLSIAEAVVVTARRNKFHPVREYLEGLKWDGVARLDTWLTTYLGVVDTPYARACARKVLCAGVMRIFKPGCKFDHVLVLEGAQRIGKSTVCGILGGAWFLDSPIDPQNKDTVQTMQGKWVIELAEMEVTRRAEADALKAFLTRQTDKVRVAYGRLASEFPRQSIFIASKNPEADGAYLKDNTGNRRWWPVACAPAGGQVDFKKFREARNQLWAEAVAVVKTKGEPLYMETEQLRTEAQETVALRHAEDAWNERVGQWLGGDARDFLTARDVFCDALGGLDKQLDRRTTLRIAGVMRTQGWETTVRWIQGRAVRGYEKQYAGIAGL